VICAIAPENLTGNILIVPFIQSTMMLEIQAILHDTTILLVFTDLVKETKAVCHDRNGVAAVSSQMSGMRPYYSSSGCLLDHSFG
jgi:hypothetical protein